jgi:hypothetical protein
MQSEDEQERDGEKEKRQSRCPNANKASEVVQ